MWNWGVMWNILAILWNGIMFWYLKNCSGLEVGAGAPSYPQTAKDQFRKVYCEAFDLNISAFYQESFSSYAQMETLLILQLVMVTSMRQSSSFLKHDILKMLIQGCYLGTKYFGSYVKGEDFMFWPNPVSGVKVSRTRKEANSGSPHYMYAACCKSYNQCCWQTFILICMLNDVWRRCFHPGY